MSGAKSSYSRYVQCPEHGEKLAAEVSTTKHHDGEIG